jgi:hypothetical protein
MSQHMLLSATLWLGHALCFPALSTVLSALPLAHLSRSLSLSITLLQWFWFPDYLTLDYSVPSTSFERLFTNLRSIKRQWFNIASLLASNMAPVQRSCRARSRASAGIARHLSPDGPGGKPHYCQGNGTENDTQGDRSHHAF